MFRALHSSPPPPIECGHHPQRALGSQSSPFCLPLPRLLRIRSESGFACPGHFTQVEIPFCGLASVFSPCRVGRVEPRCLTGQSCVPFFGSVMCHVCRDQLCSPAGGHGPFHFGARTEPCCSVCSSFSVNTFPAPLAMGRDGRGGSHGHRVLSCFTFSNWPHGKDPCLSTSSTALPICPLDTGQPHGWCRGLTADALACRSGRAKLPFVCSLATCVSLGACPHILPS